MKVIVQAGVRYPAGSSKLTDVHDFLDLRIHHVDRYEESPEISDLPQRIQPNYLFKSLFPLYLGDAVGHCAYHYMIEFPLLCSPRLL